MNLDIEIRISGDFSIMKKLHLGCGTVRIPGYLNVDITPQESVDLVADVRKLDFEFNSFDVIYSCAVIEHFGRREWKGLLKHWVSFLKPGGLFRISTNDLDAAVSRYQKEKNVQELLGLLIGGQKDDYDWHGMIFDFDTLKAGLEEAGLVNVRRYDYRETDYGELGIDDFSQAYLPHMDRENGQLMVLNLEAYKPDLP